MDIMRLKRMKMEEIMERWLNEDVSEKNGKNTRWEYIYVMIDRM